MLSSDGRCKTLDIRADGYAKGECCGVMRITPDIETQSATIDVVAKLGGCGINQDGRSSSLTAPNGPSQQTLIVDVLKRANYNASGVDRLEMHGTGTSLGDPIEVGAALEVLVSSPKSMQTTSSVPFLSSQKRNLTLEGAKTRTGHCEPGAGTVGLMFAISRMSQRLISSLTHLRILTDASLVDEGMDSLAAVELGSTLQTATGTSMPATLAFDYPTIDAIVDLVSMDPQQRILLESFHQINSENLEFDKATNLKKVTNIAIGATKSLYGMEQLKWDQYKINPYMGTGMELSVLCGRISYTFGFKGPSLAANTIISMESQIAYAGGVSLNIGLLSFQIGSAANMLSSDGRCKTLDIRADGYAKGECCGVMRITPDIETQSATIDVVAKLGGCGINQDGRSSSLTAPNGPSQQTLIVDVLKRANYNASGVDRLEMHGTGTSLGDPIEVGAALEVLVSSPKSMQTTSSVPFLSSQKRNLTLEGAKTRTGHCEPGAGTVGLMFAISRMSQRLISSLTHLRILTDASLVDEGMDSLAAVELGSTLQTATGTSMPATLAFDYPTIDAIVDLVSMDPQQRILLESFHQINSENLEFDKATNLKKVTNIAIGATKSLYGMEQLKWDQYKINPYMGTGMELSVLCGRISYTFGFKGPSVCVDTACSSSLVATQLAANTIISMESQIAYAGGQICSLVMVAAKLWIFVQMAMQKVNAVELCASHQTLKRKVQPLMWSQSLEGCGINQDGRSSSLTAPNGPSQQTLIVDVLKRANYNASGVDRLEMHGTGTSLGDPIEVGAALEVLVSSPKSMQTTSSVPFLSSQKRNLTLEGAKTRTGHCEPGAGTVGLMFAISRMSQRLISSLTHLRILTDASLVDEGMDSLAAVELGSTLQTATGTSMPATLAFDYPTIDAIVDLVSMDPQQRILLESFHQINSENLEFDKATNLKKVTNIAIGATKSLYGMEQLKWDQYKINPYMGTGMELSVLCGRISYTFGFKGPSVCVDTACSSSLVATQLAANTIISMESQIAYAGGVSLNIGLLSFQIGSAANMLSSDGRCKTLDIRADGYAKGECCGVMRITPDIETQSATIDVVAKLGGCGINQDGRSSSLTAPNGPSQQTLIVDVLKRANYNASGVDRLEMHGTGTSLGDPIEVGAALEVLVSSPKSMQTTSSVPFLSSQKRNLTLEGAKTRTGHCEPGAGTVGLMFAISRMSQRLISSLTHLRILTDASLVDEGMDSLAAVELGSTLQTATGTSMPATLAFDYPTIDAIVDLVSMDPQQRILLESFHQINSENLEFDKATNLKKVTNIAIGATKSLYGMEQLKWDQYKINPYMGTGMELSVLCGRISYTFGFKGPSVCVDTACSSSLVATQLAANTIISMESQIAYAGGVSLNIGLLSFQIGSAANMLSSDGRCKTLDIRADGYAKGECCGVMRITPDIETQSATIDVVAKLGGCGINQDGRSSSLTAPNGPSQQTLIVDVLKRANYNASGVDRLEMHGTGTSLGDPIEVGAALEVLVSSPKSMQTTSSVPFLSSQKRNLTLEGAKTRTGHCEPGAGTVGLMFAISRMSQRLISSLTHLRVLNPHVTSAMSRHNGDAKRQVTLPRQEASRPLYPQQAESVPLCSGVSGFAFQGTNAHALLYGLETQRTRGDGMCSENRLWERQRFWCVVPYHPLTPLYSDVQRRSGTFHAQASVCIDTSQALSSMLDHVINGTALLPGTAHIEMGRALAGLLANEVHGEVSLGSLSFIAPLVLEAKTTVACEVDGHGNISVGVASKTTHHATGLGIRSKARVHKICACALPSLSSDSTSGKGLQVSLPGAKQNYVYSQLYTMREVPYSYYACPAMLDGAFQSSVGATSVGVTAVEDMKGSESEQTSNRAIREGSAQNANARVPACISNVSMHGGLTTAMHGFASALIFEECAPTTTHSAVQSSHELWHLDVRRGIIHTHVFLLEGRIIQKVPTGNFESLSTPIYYQHGGSMEGRYSRTHREIYEGLSRAELGIQISSLLRGILECEIIEDVPLVEQGLDSLGAMELARVLTEMTKIKVHVETLQDNPTLKSLTTFIENEITLGMSTDPSTEKNSKEYGESINRAERKYPRSPRSEKETKARTLLYKYMQVVPWLVLFVFICIFSRLEGEFFDL
ncbi:unnamed protein product [Bathycoccus prasinos]